MDKWKIVFISLFCWLLVGCFNEPTTGAVEVKWDRHTCERCRMVLSDPVHSAQVRYKNPQGKSIVHLFDDIGCAALWLAVQKDIDMATTEIWVTDHRNGQWIDARQATYVKGHVTPMEYGLGAQSEPAEKGLTYDQAVAHIMAVEKQFNLHGQALQQQLQERIKQAESQ